MQRMELRTRKRSAVSNLYKEDDAKLATRLSKRLITEKNPVPAFELGLYLVLIFVRMGALALMLIWRVLHPNKDAMWLWAMSVICEFWFAFVWLLDQLPKLRPIKRVAKLEELKKRLEPHDNRDENLLPKIDVFVTTSDPNKEPPLGTANTILSILATDYPADKLTCYISDDAASYYTYKAMVLTVTIARLWVPFCRKYDIDPRNPDSYFGLPCKTKVDNPDFVRDHRRVKKQYEKFKANMNALPKYIDSTFESNEKVNWRGAWTRPAEGHTRQNHEGIVELVVPETGCEDEYLIEQKRDKQEGNDAYIISFDGVDTRLPKLYYVSREKHPDYPHNKKAGAMNALVRVSAILSKAPFFLNLDCDHYIYNSKALREGICFMLDKGGDKVCYVQYPQRFDGIDPSDRYANKNNVFFDVTMRAIDGIQGPFYVGTGCLFRRDAVYGYEPTRAEDHDLQIHTLVPPQAYRKRQAIITPYDDDEAKQALINTTREYEDEDTMKAKFGDHAPLIHSINLLKVNPENKGNYLLTVDNLPMSLPPHSITKFDHIEDAMKVIESKFEENTLWGNGIGWVYGSITEDVVTGYNMHNKGWRSVYCVSKPDAFRGTAPINLTDRLHQVLRWATGSMQIFFSSKNALFATTKVKFLQRIAYLNVCIYPFTSLILIMYCLIPALSLTYGHFVVETFAPTLNISLLIITLTHCALAALEIKWYGISLEEYWRNEQFWLIAGTSSHLVAVLQGLLGAISHVDPSFHVTSKSDNVDDEDEFAELNQVKWTPLMIPPILIMILNFIGMAIGFGRTIYAKTTQISELIGGMLLSFWVLAHLYPFAEGLKGRGKMPTLVFLWLGIIGVTISLLSMHETSITCSPSLHA